MCLLLLRYRHSTADRLLRNLTEEIDHFLSIGVCRQKVCELSMKYDPDLNNTFLEQMHGDREFCHLFLPQVFRMIL
jgi:hypothetical protein